MKKIFHITMSLLLAAGFAACEGSDAGDDGQTNGGGSGEIKAPFTLSVDKPTIEADGKDASTFKLVDANGNVLTSPDLLEYVRLRIVAVNDTPADEQLDRRTRSFTSMVNAKYEFSATYQGEPSANTVTITAQNRQKYEKYHKNVAIHKLTNVYCTYCPLATKAIHDVADEWQEHMVTMALHDGNFNGNDPWKIAAAGKIYKEFNCTGWPSVIMNCDKLLSKRTTADITAAVKDYLTDYPATCGIKFTSSYSAQDEAITIDASLTSSKDESFTLGYAVMLDKGSCAGGYPDELPDIYWDIVVGMSENFMAYSSKDAIDAKDGVEVNKTFTVPARIAEGSLNDMSIIVYALRRNGEGSIIDNIVKGKLGETVDYKLND